MGGGAWRIHYTASRVRDQNAVMRILILSRICSRALLGRGVFHGGHLMKGRWNGNKGSTGERPEGPLPPMKVKVGCKNARVASKRIRQEFGKIGRERCACDFFSFFFYVFSPG